MKTLVVINDFFLTYPYELLPAVGYLQTRIKWSPSCAVVFIIESITLHHSGLGFAVVFIIGKFQWPVSWKLLNECTCGFGREPLVSQTMCMQTAVNEIHQPNPKICCLSLALSAHSTPDEDHCSSLRKSTGGYVSVSGLTGFQMQVR